MRKKREDEIIKKEKEAKDFQREKFGVDGELFQVKARIDKDPFKSQFLML